MTKSLYLSLFLILLSGCQKSPSQDNSNPGIFEEASLLAHSTVYCTNGKVLTEIETNSSDDFEDLADDVSVFGFYQKPGPCALKGEIHDSFPWFLAVGHFDLSSTLNCIPNGSLWKVTSRGVATPDAHIDLESLDMETIQTIHMSATRDLTGTYPRDHAGLRRFSCQ